MWKPVPMIVLGDRDKYQRNTCDRWVKVTLKNSKRLIFPLKNLTYLSEDSYKYDYLHNSNMKYIDTVADANSVFQSSTDEYTSKASRRHL